jgi:type VI secretion system secreted protein VgrG
VLEGNTLLQTSASRVVLINGAQPCNVFWQVGSSATFGTTTEFIGHVFALTSISANHAATFQGQLLARNGAVTLDNNTITNDACAEVTPSPTPTETTTPGPLPNTDGAAGNSWVLPLSIGLGLAALGTGVFIIHRKRS